jgi:hypothetical protein
MRRALIVTVVTAAVSLAIHASSKDVLKPLRVSDGAPAWGRLSLGQPFEAVEGLVGSGLTLRVEEYESIGLTVYSGLIDYKGRDVRISFDDREGDGLRLSAVHVRRGDDDAPDAWARTSLLGELKSRLPDLTYQPSRHEPLEKEHERKVPFYALPSAPDVLVVVEPGHSLTISYSYLFD